MDLKHFVTETIVQICEGVHEANEKLKGSGGIVNPQHVVGTDDDPKKSKVYGYLIEDGQRSMRKAVHLVEFDVAVHATEGSEQKVGGGLVVATFGLGAHAKSDLASGSQSRVQFHVPVVLPHGQGA